MLLQEYRPKSRLQVKKNQIKQPRFPVIDGHNHLGASFGTDWSEGSMSELLETMDQVNVRRVIDLDGGWGRISFKNISIISNQKHRSASFTLGALIGLVGRISGIDFRNGLLAVYENRLNGAPRD